MPHEPEVGLQEDPARLQRAPAAPERVLVHRVEDDVVGHAAFPGEVLLQVVDDLVGSERSHELDVLRVAPAVTCAPDLPSRAEPPRFRWRPTRRRRGRCARGRDSPSRGTLEQCTLRRSPAAASSIWMPAGLWASALAAQHGDVLRVRSAGDMPNTASPTSNSVTAAPVATTTPATSIPMIRRLGRQRPVKKRVKNGSAARKPQSDAVDRRGLDLDQHFSRFRNRA